MPWLLIIIPNILSVSDSLAPLLYLCMDFEYPTYLVVVPGVISKLGFYRKPGSKP